MNEVSDGSVLSPNERLSCGGRDESDLHKIIINKPTSRCHHNPFMSTFKIQEPVILGEPQING